MKLAALYTIWNGLELLEGSLKQIEPYVDEVVIAWQLYSNKGERSNEIEQFIKRFENNSKIHLIEFVPDLKISTKENERRKLQLRIDKAKDLDCSHYFSAACDHYYNPDEFRRNKMLCAFHDWDLTFTRMFTYYKDPTWKLDPPEAYFMPFICKLSKSTKVVKGNSYPVKIDPSIRVTPWSSYKVFEIDDIVLHHFSMIREDIRNKFNNAAASIRWKPEQIERFVSEYESAKVGDSISYFKGRRIIKVKNTFDI